MPTLWFTFSVADNHWFHLYHEDLHLIHNNLKHACYHHEIFGCQSSIGWKNFFRGHVSKKFQERYLAAGGTKDNWTYDLLKLLWSEIYALWEIRNGYEHGVNACQRMHKRKQKLLKELQHVYSQRDYMLAIDRDQFYDTPEEHLQHHPRLSQVQSWIKMMRRTVLRSKIQAQDIALKNTKRLHSYFPSLLQPSVRKKQKKKKKAAPVLHKRSHQTYIRVLPDRQRILSLIPEKSSVTLLPRQLQPQIPWQQPMNLRQKLITE